LELYLYTCSEDGDEGVYSMTDKLHEVNDQLLEKECGGSLYRRTINLMDNKQAFINKKTHGIAVVGLKPEHDQRSYDKRLKQLGINKRLGIVGLVNTRIYRAIHNGDFNKYVYKSGSSNTLPTVELSPITQLTFEETVKIK
jgi:hypothetical protein